MAKVIKRYSNRKLYDTETSKYITLKEVVAVIAGGQEIQVIENTTKADITGQTLVMALVETEQSLNGQTKIISDILRCGGLAKFFASLPKRMSASNDPVRDNY